MIAAPRKPMTLAEFLSREETQELRCDFDGFEPVAMTGGTRAHEIIGGNVRFAVQSLPGTRCRIFGPAMTIEVAGRIRYTDAFVVRTPGPSKQTVARDPVVMFEVLSEGTSRTDLIEKLREYGATPSIQRYVILEQDSIAAMVFVRTETGLGAETLTAEDTLRMPEIDVDVPMAEFYAGIEFADGGAAQAG